MILGYVRKVDPPAISTRILSGWTQQVLFPGILFVLDPAIGNTQGDFFQCVQNPEIDRCEDMEQKSPEMHALHARDHLFSHILLQRLWSTTHCTV